MNLAVLGRVDHVEDRLLDAEDRAFQFVPIRTLLVSREPTAGFRVDEQRADGGFVQVRQIEGVFHDGRRSVQEVPIRFEGRRPCLDLGAGQRRHSVDVIREIADQDDKVIHGAQGRLGRRADEREQRHDHEGDRIPLTPHDASPDEGRHVRAPCRCPWVRVKVYCHSGRKPTIPVCRPGSFPGSS